MHLGIPALLDFYRQHKADDSLVLVTIIAIEGSTYRKPGAMMLISRDQQFEGMISGTAVLQEGQRPSSRRFCTMV